MAAGSSIEGSCCLCTLGRRGVPPGDLHREIMTIILKSFSSYFSMSNVLNLTLPIC